MADDKLPSSLQESLLALLAFDNQEGAVVAAQVKPEHFGVFYQELAGPILQYRDQYHAAPGHAHLDDIFGDRLFQGEKAPRYRKTLQSIVELARGINAQYVASKTQDFVRWQLLKGAVVQAAELCGNKGSNLEQIEDVLFKALKAPLTTLSPGSRIDDNDFSFLDRNPVDYYTNIAALDRLQFGATKKQLLLYIGPKGTGKSWFCVHMGKQGLLQQARVLHISNEMDEASVLGRYYQALMSASVRNRKYLRTSLELDEFKRFLGIESEHVRPKLNFAQPNIRQILRERIKSWGLRFGSILIKEFPSGTLTMSKFERYLDQIAATEKFIPTMVIMDYPDLMKHDLDNYRLSIGQTFTNLRGSAAERSYALVAPTQGGRATIGAKKVRSTNVTEDISKVFTADNTLTYARTEAEKRMNLARLFVAHARNTGEGDGEIIISQAYAVGQYALESAFMSSSYWEKMKEENGDDDEG